MQSENETNMNSDSPTPAAAAPRAPFPSLQRQIEADERSVFVGNVNYSAFAGELEQHFRGCGTIKRVTIVCDNETGYQKGYAYVEFEEKDSVEAAVGLHDSVFKGRRLKVQPKRTNWSGIMTPINRGQCRGRGGRGRGGRSRGGGGADGGTCACGGSGHGRGYMSEGIAGSLPGVRRGGHGYPNLSDRKWYYAVSGGVMYCVQFPRIIGEQFEVTRFNYPSGLRIDWD